jgi:hypothetical protein
MHNYPNPNDIDTGLLMLAAVVVLLIAGALWIENWLDNRTIRKLEEAGKRARESYGYRQLWQEREERFWSQLKHSAHLDIARNMADHATELAAIRAQITGIEMDTDAARKEIRGKMLCQ